MVSKRPNADCYTTLIQDPADDPFIVWELIKQGIVTFRVDRTPVARF
jgi:hypothetical protein